ncbi:immunity protein 50 of polymorphic toxin system [Luteimonas cucumeris]|uniref:Immunity protein 50 of polymorphic toxin system n=1 Tax=Luteimonas cucumeris TaxID=985012 RepID=A0A562KTY3_9GAMM|nr:Imm50 family immunity protein [Luteimonas cucumeris]TWH98878.1 immunity protein 50 of polymorphic toxin system [Luteimonas cucumeris]
MISNSDAVTSIFGYWPDFADARLMSFDYSAKGVVTLELSYIDASAGKSAVVALLFTGVRDIQLGELASDNVLDRLDVADSTPLLVTLEPCIGLGGSFTCTAATVTGVVPNNSFKPNPLRGSA